MKNSKKVNIIISLIVFVILLVIIILSNMNKEKLSFLEYISNNITKPFVNYKVAKENEQMSDLDGIKYQDLKTKLKEQQEDIEKKKLELRQIEVLNSKITELTEMLNLKNRYSSIEGIIGKVTEESKNNLEEVVTINIGKNQGIKEGRQEGEREQGKEDEEEQQSEREGHGEISREKRGWDKGKKGGMHSPSR